MGSLGLFCGVWNLCTRFGTSSVACLETWSKRSRSMAFSDWDIYRNTLVFALLVKPQSSWKKVAISSVLDEQKAQHIFLLPPCRSWADEQASMILELCMVLLLKCSWYKHVKSREYVYPQVYYRAKNYPALNMREWAHPLCKHTHGLSLLG